MVLNWGKIKYSIIRIHVNHSIILPIKIHWIHLWEGQFEKFCKQQEERKSLPDMLYSSDFSVSALFFSEDCRTVSHKNYGS